MSEKIYCGNAKKIKTQYGELIKISFSKEDRQKLEQNANENGWVNVLLKERKNPTETQTHYLQIDNYKPQD